MKLGHFYKYLGPRHTSTGRLVVRIEVEIEDFKMTPAGTWANAVKVAYDKAVAGDAPPAPPTLAQVPTPSGKPYVFGLDADDVAAFDALGTDSGAGTLTAAEAATQPANSQTT